VEGSVRQGWESLGPARAPTREAGETQASVPSGSRRLLPSGS